MLTCACHSNLGALSAACHFALVHPLSVANAPLSAVGYLGCVPLNLPLKAASGSCHFSSMAAPLSKS